MRLIFKVITKLRYFFLALWVGVTIFSIIMIPRVNVNYDTTAYLPNNMRVKESLKVMEKEFGLTGQASVMIEEVTISETLVFKDRIEAFPYVLEVVWIDSFIERDILLDIDNLFKEYDPNGTFDFGSIPGLNSFYKEKSSLLQIVFTESDHSQNVGQTIEKMRDYLTRIRKPFAMRGTAVNAYYTQKLTESEVLKITLYVVPIILLILVLFTNSWAEPLIFLLSVGVSVLVNMGTNAFLPSVSFLTNSAATLLQLAISMDYSIFLLHSYQKERESGLDKKDAMISAMLKSFVSINSSMLTTVAGFVALMFMRYSIGLDLGVVMIKGILISIIATFTFMPALILLSDNIVLKLKHRSFIPKFGFLAKPIVKLRYVLPAIVLLILIPTYNAQNNNKFVYGEAAMSVSDGAPPAREKARIDAKFGKSNMIVILVPLDSEGLYASQEKVMINQLHDEFSKANEDYKASIQSYSSLTDIQTYIGNFDKLPQPIKDFLDKYVDSAILESLITPEYKKQFISEHYSRVIISINSESESPRAEKAVDIIEMVVERQPFGADAHIIGVSPSIKEIKKVVEQDFMLVNILSIALVFVILLVSFKSVVIPLILVFVIQLSIWINMAIPFLSGTPLIFIGYMIVSAVQLGATIDYGILFTQFYLEGRLTMLKRDAIRYAINNSGHSVLTSALILTAAGYALKFFSSVEGVAGLGELIGRGAALSGVLVLFLLPQLLYLFDKVIEKLTWKTKFYRLPKEPIKTGENEVREDDPSLLS